MRIPAGERAIGVLGYLPLLCLLIARWVRRDSMFVQFHSRQGSVLFGLYVALCLLLGIGLLVAGGAGILPTLLIGILFLATFVYVAMALIGVLKALFGERYRMPVVADVALMMGL